MEEYFLNDPFTHFVDIQRKKKRVAIPNSQECSGVQKQAHFYNGRHIHNSHEPAGYKKAHFIQPFAGGRPPQVLIH